MASPSPPSSLSPPPPAPPPPAPPPPSQESRSLPPPPPASQQPPARGPVALAPVGELRGYSAAIAAELGAAEAQLGAAGARPFGGRAPAAVAAVAGLRARQLDLCRHHVEIERRFAVPAARGGSGGDGGEGDGAGGISFSTISDSMQAKEAATADLLRQLDGFDRDLRAVIAQFEPGIPDGAGAGASGGAAGAAGAGPVG